MSIKLYTMPLKYAMNVVDVYGPPSAGAPGRYCQRGLEGSLFQSTVVQISESAIALAHTFQEYIYEFVK